MPHESRADIRSQLIFDLRRAAAEKVAMALKILATLPSEERAIDCLLEALRALERDGDEERCNNSIASAAEVRRPPQDEV